MAEFQEVMRHWKRMCDAYTTDDSDCCSDCPVGDLHEHGCGAIFETEDTTDWQEYANAIMAWAEEHPEPKYPSWLEWLENMGIVSKAKSEYSEVFDTICVGTRMFYPIPADIAEKLGLEPKEG